MRSYLHFFVSESHGRQFRNNSTVQADCASILNHRRNQKIRCNHRCQREYQYYSCACINPTQFHLTHSGTSGATTITAALDVYKRQALSSLAIGAYPCPVLNKKMERVMGIEPTQPAWKAGILPLNYTRIS